MSRLIIKNHCDHTTMKTKERNMCVLDNITTIPIYHTNDSLSYMAIIVVKSGMNSRLAIDTYTLLGLIDISSSNTKRQHQHQQHRVLGYILPNNNDNNNNRNRTMYIL